QIRGPQEGDGRHREGDVQAMSWNGWDTHPNGGIAVFPVTGWSTVTFMNGMAGGLRIEFSTDPSMKNQSAKQLILTEPWTANLAKSWRASPTSSKGSWRPTNRLVRLAEEGEWMWQRRLRT